MSRKKKVWTYLPEGEYLFRIYYEEMGLARSHQKLIKRLVSEGYINPKTGKPPSSMSTWNRMWRWALHKENQQKAYEMYNSALKDTAEYVSPEEWQEFLHDKALSALNMSPKTMRDFNEGRY